MLQLTYFQNQWELSIVEYSDKIWTGTKNTKISKHFEIFFLKSYGIEDIKPGVRKNGSQTSLDCCRRNEGDSVNYWEFPTIMKISLKMVNVQKNFRKIVFEVLSAIKFNSFQQKSTYTLSPDSIERQKIFLMPG